jgi:D-glucosaminate-6-phosphate ammonia-lyase
VFRSAPKNVSKKEPVSPAAQLDGAWDVAVKYTCGAAEHKLFLNTSGNTVSGVHIGWAGQGDLKGRIDGDRVEFRSELPSPGQRVSFRFSGRITEGVMSGEIDAGEYGDATWTARRRA